MIMEVINTKGYTLIEIIITMAIGAIVISATVLGLFSFRSGFEYDILLNQVVESANYSKLKAVSSVLDLSESRISFSVKFFEDKIVEFEGEEYVEGADNNVEYEVPIGLRLSSTCSPNDNGTVIFAPITGVNSNSCTIYIYKFEQINPTGSIVIGKFGVEQAS